MFEFEIGRHRVGQGNPVFFIAEAGVNHNGSLDLAKQLVDVASDAGADAVKFQSFHADEIATKMAPKSTYHQETTGGDEVESWFDMLKRQEMSKEMHEELISYCNKKKIIFASTPYDLKSLHLLCELDVSVIKIASTDTNNLPFLRHVGTAGRPIILSSAMATMKEVSEAVETIKHAGSKHFAVMQCTGNYPADLQNSNLNVMHSYREAFGCPVGYSDHTAGIVNPIAATAMGANIYEKHFTLSRDLAGPDHRMSIEPEELRETIALVRQAQTVAGSAEKQVVQEELENRVKLRKSIVSREHIKAGKSINSDMICLKRPATGMLPRLFDTVVGSVALVDIPADTPITQDMIDA